MKIAGPLLVALSVASTAAQASPLNSVADSQAQQMVQPSKLRGRILSDMQTVAVNQWSQTVEPVLVVLTQPATQQQIETALQISVKPFDGAESFFAAQLTLKQIAVLSASSAVNWIEFNAPLVHAD